jgi:hypothetical protein
LTATAVEIGPAGVRLGLTVCGVDDVVVLIGPIVWNVGVVAVIEVLIELTVW